MARSSRKPGSKQDFNEGIYHRPPAGLSFFKTGVVFLILMLILVYFAFAKQVPWSSPGYTATATFSDASTLRQSAPVRIAGVNVGEVTNVEADGEGAAKVTFSVDPEGLPIHDDARITIRPRLFLEGNYFLDLQPGNTRLAPQGIALVEQGHVVAPLRRGPGTLHAGRPAADHHHLLWHLGWGLGVGRIVLVAQLRFYRTDVGQIAKHAG